jgi:hypothetical protein
MAQGSHGDLLCQHAGHRYRFGRNGATGNLASSAFGRLAPTPSPGRVRRWDPSADARVIVGVRYAFR